MLVCEQKIMLTVKHGNNCKKCKYGIFQKLNKQISYPKINLIIDDLIKYDEKNTKNML